tara:strand:- start:344 stop:976 length:633 start_codon:yes stop_codon:yes gene_type:complete
MFTLTKEKFTESGTWGVALEEMTCPNHNMLALFDQSGYDLCPLEQEYAKVNMSNVDLVRYRKAIAKPWFDNNKTTGAHINHSYLFERKGYHGYALEQLGHWSESNHLIHKMTQIKPKWGIDFSLDYVDENRYNTMELFHYEWDDNVLDTVLDKKNDIEEIIFKTDWEEFAKYKIEKKDEWYNLDFVGQSAWTTKQLSLPEERFKLVTWGS